MHLLRPGDVLEYEDETHAYTLNGRRIPSVTEIVSLITDRKYADTNPALLEQAKCRGTAVHELCEAIDCGVEPEALEIEPELVGYVNAYLAFLRDYRPQWDYIEKVVYTPDYAGRVDRIGRIDGDAYVVEIKTTSSMDRLSKLALYFQLDFYVAAVALLLPYASTIKTMGVQLKKDGTYTAHDGEKIAKRYMTPSEVCTTSNSLLNLTYTIGGYEHE